MTTTCVRPGRPSDLDRLASMRHDLWPDGPIEEHRGELVSILAGNPPTTMPLFVLVAEAGGQIVGFLEASLRSYAEGCDPAIAVGYVEGWYVVPGHRHTGVGARLLAAAEDWARRQGCMEMASDASIENELSQRVHRALGFEEVARSVNYRKSLRV